MLSLPSFRGRGHERDETHAPDPRISPRRDSVPTAAEQYRGPKPARPQSSAFSWLVASCWRGVDRSSRSPTFARWAPEPSCADEVLASPVRPPSSRRRTHRAGAVRHGTYPQAAGPARGQAGIGHIRRELVGLEERGDQPARCRRGVHSAATSVSQPCRNREGVFERRECARQ